MLPTTCPQPRRSCACRPASALTCARNQPGPPEPDPTAELLWRLAKEKGLTAYAMFEIVGRHRPEWLRLAPKALHDAITDYVLDKVLASPSPASPAIPGTAVITASLGPAAP